MTDRSAPVHQMPHGQFDRFGAVWTVLLVAIVAIASSLIGLDATAIAGQAAAPNPEQAPTPEVSPHASPSAMATPMPEEVDWSNGAKAIWTFESASSSRADDFSSSVSDVFGVYESGSDVLQVFDSTTFEKLWTIGGAGGSYPWRSTPDVFFIAGDMLLIAREPRSGGPLWTYRPPSWSWTWTTDDNVPSLNSDPPRYVYITSGFKFTVLDIETGRQIYQLDGVEDSIFWQTSGNVMTVSDGNMLSRVDLSEGKERWRYSGVGPGIQWEHSGDVLYVTSGGTLAVLDSDTGAEQWRFTGSGGSVSLNSRYDDVVYAMSGRNISALDPKTGVERWRFTAGTEDPRLRFVDDALFVQSGPSVSSIDTATGVECWRFTVAGTDHAGVFESDEGHLYVLGDSSITMLDADTGMERWRYTSRDNLDWWTSDDDGLYLLADETLVFLDPATGAERWRSIRLPVAWWSSSSRTINGDLIVPTDTSIVVINSGTGETRLQVSTDENGDWRTDNGVLYVSDSKVAMAAYDMTTGKPLWQHLENTRVSIRSIREDMIYLTAENRVIALDRATGEPHWTFETEAWIASFEMDDAIIRLTDESGTLYALGPKSIELENGGAAITTTDVILRAAPNSSAVERGALPANTAVTITGDSEEHDRVTWWPVASDEDGAQGWVPADALKPTANAPARLPTPAA